MFKRSKIKGVAKGAAFTFIPFLRPVANMVRTAKDRDTEGKDMGPWKTQITSILILTILGIIEPIMFIIGTGSMALVSLLQKDKLTRTMGWIHLAAFLMAITFRMSGVL